MAGRPPPPQARTLDASDWDGFVDRRGVVVTTALLLVSLSLVANRVHATALGRDLAGPQLLLLLIVLGCVGVLAYRAGAD